ncbi:MAG: HAMP domain-containing sensor histidine kinase [Neisseria sp.]|nr:HAMP domain-containing sensor histidine kinase [Neisseria sp.]
MFGSSNAAKNLFSHHGWETQIERLVRLVNWGRVVILLFLLALYGSVYAFGLDDLRPLRSLTQFAIWVAAYALIIVLSFIYPEWQRQKRNDLPDAGAVVDISMVLWFVLIADGIHTGFAVLVLPFIVTSCLFAYGRYPLLYATYTSILLLIVLILHANLRWFGGVNNRTIINAALLLLASFIVAYLTAYSAKYLNSAASETEKHKREATRFRGLNKLVLNGVQEGVVVLDETLRVLLFNKQAKTYFPTLIPNEENHLFGELVARWQHNPNVGFEQEIQLSNQMMQVRAIPLLPETQDADGMILPSHTEQLLIVYVRSSREVAHAAMASKLASLGQLAANLAHEVRNPMSAIRHANDLLQEGKDDPVAQKLHGIIDGNIRRIDTMLEDVSLLNKKDRIEQGKVDLMRFWLDFKQEFILNNPEAIASIQLKHHEANMQVWADSSHLQRILWNLCNNAWRHSRKDGDAVCVLMRSEDEEHVSIVVMDNGDGVPLDIRSRLFEPFFTTSANGTGLGLYIARELAIANQGQLRYLPEINGFELILRREKQHEI